LGKEDNVQIASVSRCSFQLSTKGRSAPHVYESLRTDHHTWKSRELCITIDDKVLPILEKQTGFVDETVLASDTESNCVLALSFWNAKENAECYHQEQHPNIREMLSHFLDTAPAIRIFDVHTSTTQRVATGQAA
jgi:hypothetical protein